MIDGIFGDDHEEAAVIKGNIAEIYGDDHESDIKVSLSSLEDTETDWVLHYFCKVEGEAVETVDLNFGDIELECDYALREDTTAFPVLFSYVSPDLSDGIDIHDVTYLEN